MSGYLEPTAAAGRDFMRQHRAGPVVMLNLLRFRAQADYSEAPQLAPATPISGAAAYRLYIEHTLPWLRASGGTLLFMGTAGSLLIGPASERWDLAMLVQQASAESFLGFATHREYLAGLGHRTAALEDSRLLPLWEVPAGGAPTDAVSRPASS